MSETECRAILGWKEANPIWTGNYDYFQGKPPHGGTLTAFQRISPLGLPPILSIEETCEVFGSPVLLSRLYSADWLPSLAEFQDDLYFTSEVVYAALGRLVKGEKPPRTASEPPATAGHPEIGPKENFITPQQAAEFLSIAVSTLRGLADRGIVPSYRLPNNSTHRRYKLSDLEAVMQQGRVETFDSTVSELRDLLR